MNEPVNISQDQDSAGSDEKKLTKAIIWSTLSNWSAEAISSVVILILASLLRPADFGLVAMATVYIAFLEMALGFGLNAAIIQKKDLNSGHLNSVFWLILIASACFAGLSIALSGWWATLYSLPKLGPVIIALSLGLPLQGLTTVQQALLQRRMDFRSLAIRNNGALVAGAVIGIAMALSGFGVWALVAQSLSRQLIGLLLLWTVSDWRPSLHFSFRETHQLLGYSSKVFLASLAGFVHSQSDALLIGIFYGPTAVGIYRLGERLVSMALKLLTRAIHVVALPHFSAFQHDRKQLRLALISCWRKSAALTVPGMFLLAAISDDLVRLIGPQWTIAPDVIKLLSLVGIASAISLFTGPVLQAAGRPGLQAFMAWMLAVGISVSFSITGLLTQHLSSYWQVTLMAISRAAVFFLMYLPINLWLARFVSGVSYKDLVAATWRTIVIGISIFLSVRCVSFSLKRLQLPVSILVLTEVFAAVAVWAAVLCSLDGRIRKRVGTMLRTGRGKNPLPLRPVHQMTDP